MEIPALFLILLVSIPIVVFLSRFIWFYLIYKIFKPHELDYPAWKAALLAAFLT